MKELQDQINKITLNCADTTKEFSLSLMEVQSDIKIIKNDNKRALDKLDVLCRKIDSFDEKYARKQEVDDIKSNIKWVVRLVIGAVIAAMLKLLNLI
jgi:hypothetical protein